MSFETPLPLSVDDVPFVLKDDSCNDGLFRFDRGKVHSALLNGDTGPVSAKDIGLLMEDGGGCGLILRAT